MRVLIVEDQAISALTLEHAISRAGHEVVGCAATLHEAISLTKQTKPQLAFVDIDLDFQGAGLIIARNMEVQGVAVVYMTARPERARRDPFAIGLLPKPFQPSQAAESVSVIESILAGDMPPSVPSALELFERRPSNPPAGELPVLLAEDDPKDVELTLAAFRHAHLPHPVIIARDGHEALQRLNSPDGTLPVAALLLDLKMPKVDGFEVLRHVKANPKLQGIPIIVLSASAQERDIRTCYELGAAAYVSKPATLQELRDTLVNLAPLWSYGGGSEALH